MHHPNRISESDLAVRCCVAMYASQSPALRVFIHHETKIKLVKSVESILEAGTKRG